MPKAVVCHCEMAVVGGGGGLLRLARICESVVCWRGGEGSHWAA